MDVPDRAERFVGEQVRGRTGWRFHTGEFAGGRRVVPVESIEVARHKTVGAVQRGIQQRDGSKERENEQREANRPGHHDATHCLILRQVALRVRHPDRVKKSENVTELTLSAEQQAVFDAIETTRDHIFVTGRAGTGKSTLLNHLSWQTSKQVVICAPTGVAALNVGGQTIHSLFRLPIGVIADHEIEQSNELRKLLGTLDTIVIDEVSMVNADLLDAIDRSMRLARQRPHEAFGGAQVVLFGDPYQLAPVPGDADERAYFEDQYRSMWFFDAKVWNDADLTIYELSTIHRQHEDEFKYMLNAVR